MASLKEVQVNEFLDSLSSEGKIPAGGSTAALAGALAASLTSMVSSIVYEHVGDNPALQVDMKNYIQRAEHLRLMLEGCIDEDARMYELLMDAYHLPKDLEGRTERLQRALRNAASVPMKVATLSCKVIELCNELYPQVKGLKISEIGVAAMMAFSAIQAATLSVKINTYMIKDRDFAERQNKQVDGLETKYLPIAKEVYKAVTDRVTR